MKSITELKRAPPGRRFYARYRDWRRGRPESYLASAFYIVLGVLAVILGIVFSFWPVIPGFVFVLAGFALLSARSQWIARRLDKGELAIRRALPQRWHGRKKSTR